VVLKKEKVLQNVYQRNGNLYQKVQKKTLAQNQILIKKVQNLQKNAKKDQNLLRNAKKVQNLQENAKKAQNLQKKAKKVQNLQKNAEIILNLHRKIKEDNLNLDVFSQVILFKHLWKLQFPLQSKLLHQLPHV
jgi:hypothetical protein